VKNKWLLILGVLIIGLGCIVSGPLAEASKITELEEKKNEVQDKKQGIQSELEKARSELNSIKNEQERLIAEINLIDAEIGKTNAMIAEKNKEIDNTKKQIEKLQAEIKELEERIKKRNELLKDRARSLQESGGTISYIDVLLGAKSFSDFIDRVNTVTTIMEADKEIINEHMADQELLENSKKEVETELVHLESMKEELEAAKKSLSDQRVEKDTLIAELREKEQHAHEHVMSIEEEQKLLKAQEAAIQKAIELEKQRLAELERQKQENGGGGGSAPPPSSSGSFMRPANGIVTSGFGPRWGRNHNGIDIANVTGTPIYASASGTVIQVQTGCQVGVPSCGGYFGNHVFLLHNVNGQFFTTVYAHLNSVHVSNGQQVVKGQQIGTMGSTGDSTGPHLHFEIHPGGFKNPVNPRNYINF